MPFDDPGEVRIELILVSDDETHARALLNDLNASRYTYLVTRIVKRDTMFAEFDKAIEAARDQRPVLVFADFEMLKRQIEPFAARIVELRRGMAIACVVTRAPNEPHLRTRLRELGATVFDGGASLAEALRLH